MIKESAKEVAGWKAKHSGAAEEVWYHGYQVS
jgi:hypothetical protein